MTRTAALAFQAAEETAADRAPSERQRAATAIIFTLKGDDGHEFEVIAPKGARACLGPLSSAMVRALICTPRSNKVRLHFDQDIAVVGFRSARIVVEEETEGAAGDEIERADEQPESAVLRRRA